MTLASDTAQHGPVESPAVDAGLLAPFVARYREAPSTVQFVLAHADGRDVNRIKVMDDSGRVRIYVDDPGQSARASRARGDDD